MVLRNTMTTWLLSTLMMLCTSHTLTSAALITTTESPDHRIDVGVEPEGTFIGSPIPEIYEMYIRTNVTNRYAITSITSKVKNAATKAQEAEFVVVLPEKAFISEFVMEIGGKSYKAHVKEKEEAKNIYNEAVSRGQSAAHVEVSARDSNKFTVSLNLEPESKAVFKLIYEELLKRQKGKYEVVLNIHPGQIVPEMEVEVVIDETAPLTFVRTPSLRSGNEIEKVREDLKPNAEIIKINSTSSIVKFYPDREEQRKFAKALNTKETDGLKGQFVVEYDVERNNTGGEVLLNDGYFVHFFAPEGLENIPKQVVFVLDISGSMWGKKMQHLIDAMIHILDDLEQHDSFSIVAFDTTVNVWNIGSGWIDVQLGYGSGYGQLENILTQKEIPLPILATPENIATAKTFVKTIGPRSLTNIIGGLEVGLFIVKRAQQNISEYHQPLVVFLTDGQANVGISNGDAIINTVAKLNPKEKQTPIFSLSFGEGADKEFLRKLSSRNMGFSRHIFDAADASLQLQDFYQLISSPIMKDVIFKYTKDATVATKHRFPIFFRGSEFIVAGRIPKDPKNEYMIEGWRPGGPIMMKPEVIEPLHSLERLWAFLSVQQILEEREVAEDKTELTKKAVDLALKYSFVTPVTSLVVVKPNATDAVNTEDASKSHKGFGGDRYWPTNSINRNAMSPSLLPGYSSSMPISFSGGHHNRFMPAYSPSASNYFSMRGGGFQGFPRRPYPVSVPSYPPPTTVRVTVQLPVNLPELDKQEWFRSISDKFSIRIPQLGSFKLATNETVITKQPCAKTVLNKAGNCTLIHECPTAIPSLTDLPTFLIYFCPLERYAGVCCDN